MPYRAVCFLARKRRLGEASELGGHSVGERRAAPQGYASGSLDQIFPSLFSDNLPEATVPKLDSCRPLWCPGTKGTVPCAPRWPCLVWSWDVSGLWPLSVAVGVDGRAQRRPGCRRLFCTDFAVTASMPRNRLLSPLCQILWDLHLHRKTSSYVYTRLHICSRRLLSK